MEDKDIENRIFIEKKKVFIDGELNVRKFNELDTKLQAKILKEILEDVYVGKKLEIDNKYVLKCLKLTCDEFDNNVHLPLGLFVLKENDIITFEFQKRVGPLFLILLLFALLFTAIGATYSGARLMVLVNLNKDLDGDKVADLNIDTNSDDKPEINIDTDGDDKPNMNIDYMGNREAIFNVVIGDEIINPMNQMSEDGTTCLINCDTNDDGWPDTNLDLNNDGEPELFLDFDHDGSVDMNIDSNKDGVCDIHCDTNQDSICDKNCVVNIGEVQVTQNGSSTIVGSTITTNETASLEIVYQDMADVVKDGIIPDDMEGASTVIPNKVFTIENKSSYYVKYGLKWLVDSNNFESNNFKYSVTSDNGGGSLNYTTAPWEDQVFLKELIIAPHAKQQYIVRFKLEGINEPQNYDKNKEFIATINVVFVYD